MAFSTLKQDADNRNLYTFTLSPINVTYANTLRRIILTGVETIAFRSDMTSTGSTTNVNIKHNDTPMTNEMLADRIGLIPIHIKEPLTWKGDDYYFTIDVKNDKDSIGYVTASDFKITKETKIEDLEEKVEEIETALFFPPNHLTGDTPLITTLQPRTSTHVQKIHIVAKATKGTGREHARFSPVSQCSYEYTVDDNPERIDALFFKWLSVSKKIENIDKKSERYDKLLREFNTMQRKRCFLINEKNEPYSFDFAIETVGVLSIPYIVHRACEVAENMCSMYVNLDKSVPSEVTITSTDSRIIGYDFLFRGHDHTLGNLLQTWLVEHHIEGKASPKITYAGYSIPHPLRDEMLLRIGVDDDEELTARKAIAAAAKGCVEMFRKLRNEWNNVSQYGAKESVPMNPVVSKSRSVRKVRASAATSISAPAINPKEILQEPLESIKPSILHVLPSVPAEASVLPSGPYVPAEASVLPSEPAIPSEPAVPSVPAVPSESASVKTSRKKTKVVLAQD